MFFAIENASAFPFTLWKFNGGFGLTTGVLTCNLETGPYFIDISVLVLCFPMTKFP